MADQICKDDKMNDDTTMILTPERQESQSFTDAARGRGPLGTALCSGHRLPDPELSAMPSTNGKPQTQIRAFYPEIRLTVTSHDKIDSRLSFGHVSRPGTYSTTITRPDLFRNYLTQQIGLLMENHNVPVQIGVSDTPIPVHFAVAGKPELHVPHEGSLDFSLRDVFDVPDLATTNDDIVNGTRTHNPDGSRPLAPFTAQRVDYSLSRLSHYTATDAIHFQNYVLFTNYQFYVR